MTKRLTTGERRDDDPFGYKAPRHENGKAPWAYRTTYEEAIRINAHGILDPKDYEVEEMEEMERLICLGSWDYHVYRKGSRKDNVHKDERRFEEEDDE